MDLKVFLEKFFDDQLVLVFNVKVFVLGQLFFILVLWILVCKFKESIIELVMLVLSLLNFYILFFGLIYILVQIFCVNFFLEDLIMIYLFYVNIGKDEYGYFLLIDRNLESQV